jgi:hypothetical protein
MSDSAGFLERLVSALLINRLETARRYANTHKLLQLRHPNTLALQIWRENPRHHFRDVPPYTTFLLGQTAPVNHAAAHCSGSCDMTNLHVAKKPRNLPSLSLQVKQIVAQHSLRNCQPSLFALNAQLVAAVKPSSIKTNRFCAAIIAQS